MHRIVVTGCGTGIGKTVVSAILVTALQADYWKPVESGVEQESDTETMRRWLPNACVHPSRYALKAAVSPHQAARRENITIDPTSIVKPTTPRTLVMETAGGPLVPLTDHLLSVDLFVPWSPTWIIVSRHYLGSINHTLLTAETLRRRGQWVLGIIFNGDDNPDTEQTIVRFSQLPCLGSVRPEPLIQPTTIQRYAERWKPELHRRLTEPKFTS